MDKKNYLVISALGSDKTGIVNDLSEAALNSGCNIADSRMVALGGEFAIILMASGNWNDIAKLESMLPGLQKRSGLTIITRRTEQRAAQANLIPYEVEVVSIDHPGIVYQLAHFFSTRNINIEELNTGSYSAAHTGTPMFSLNMVVDVPADLHIAQLREEFLDFCDALNMDAVIEPSKR